MNFLKSTVIMLSLYTKIPVPFVEWDDENRKHVLTVLPLAGFITGAFEILWLFICELFMFPSAVFAAGACAAAAAVTGGIHLDGLADTADARASYAGHEKKQQILADPHMGAFGALALVIYELVCFAFFQVIYRIGDKGWIIHTALMLICIFTASRAIVQLGIALVKPARNEGMLYTFSSVSSRRLLILNASAVLAVCQCALVRAFGPPALVFSAACALLLIYFRYMAYKEFGGISGDLCGWLIEISVAVLLIAAAAVLRMI